MKKLLTVGAVLAAFSSPAFANNCPNLIKKTEEMAKAMPGDAATMKKYDELIALAKKEHGAGNHDASVKAVTEAWKLLGMDAKQL
jgi:hypothetical protein